MPLATTRISNMATLAKNKERLCVGMIVPESRAGVVIGSKGAGLEQLRIQSGGCKLQVQRADTTSPSRRVNLFGNEQQISAAFGLVCQKALLNDDERTATVFIPANRAGIVAGKGGENLKVVRQMCNVKVSLGREPVTDAQTGREERCVTLEGDSHRLIQAFSLAIFGSQETAYLGTDVLSETLSLGIIIPEDRVGVIIGSSGCGLKDARLRSGGCKLEVVRNSETIGSRRLNLTGNIDQVSAAFVVFCGKAYQEETRDVLTVLIPENRTGSVVGKGGENLKMVRETCGVKVSLGKDSTLDTQMGRPERSVLFEGEPHQLSQAFSITLTLLARSVTYVQPPSEDPEHVQIHMLIPAKQVGTIVGTDGTNIKRIGAVSGCNCSVTNRDGCARRVVIAGGYDHAESAQSSIWEQMQAAAHEANEVPPSKAHIIFFVRKEAAGAVLGKKGAKLRSISKQSSTTMKLGKNEIQGHRAVSINGPLQSVLMAEKLVFEAVTHVDVAPSATSTKRKGVDQLSKGSRFAKRGRIEGVSQVA